MGYTGGVTVELTVRGMTCASCVARVEKRLNALDGVTATVNLATETATASVPDSVTVRDLIEAVEGAGYAASVPEPEAEAEGEVREFPWRLVAAVTLAIPVA